METKDRISPLTGKEGSEIDFKVAIEWTKNHRHRNPDHVVSQFFGHEIINKILAQPGCIGLRFYYANSKPVTGWERFKSKYFATKPGEVHLIISGVNKDGTDQLPGQAAPHTGAIALKVTAAAENILAEQSVPCPGAPNCPKNALSGS